MPYIRTVKGIRAQFKPTFVASLISHSFQTIFDGKVSSYRNDIQALTEKSIEKMNNILGNDPASEWTEFEIINIIESILRESAFEDVHAVFLEKHPKIKKNRTVKSKTAAFDPIMTQPDSDPLWLVQHKNRDPSLDIYKEKSLEFSDLGLKIGRDKKITALQTDHKNAKRSEWITWWKKQAQEINIPMDMMALEEESLKMGPALRSLSPHEWWEFWQPIFDEAMKKDPRLVYLLQKAQIRRFRAALTGHHWLYGTELTQNDLIYKLPLVDDNDSKVWYQRLWMDYIQRFDEKRLKGYSLESLARLLKPERDYDLDWRGYQKLQTSESLRPLVSDFFWKSSPDWSPLPGSHEPPQWAWMRLAMVLASQEEDSYFWAAKWYESFSTLRIIPSESLLRQAGKRSPKMIEDMAARVSDNFEATQEAIYQAALNTKWTGTVSLNWGLVRAKGSPIAGRRVSQGVASFVKAIDTNLATQGRPKAEKPVTVSLPIWHREVEDFLNSTQESQCIQTVLCISDLFMERLRKNEKWALFDPAFFSMLEDNNDEAYLSAEKEAKKIIKTQPQAVKWISTQKLWNKILKQVHKTGRPFLLFNGIQKSFEPFPNHHPVQHGIDGVGALPLPMANNPLKNLDNSKSNGITKSQTDETYQESMPWVMWPSAAVNLKEIISENGTPDVVKLKETTALALRMLDNAFILSEEEGRLASWASAHRSVCLGVVGFQEAIERASLAAKDDPEIVDAWVGGLAETWATAVISADQDLKKERGPAPAWREPQGRVYNPIQSMERFRIQRGGRLQVPFKTQTNWEEVAKRIQNSGGHRMSARTLWAPFQTAAAIAAVSPGGIGPLAPVEKLIDENGNIRWMPTPALLMFLFQNPQTLSAVSKVLKFPENPGKWPDFIQKKASPDIYVWKTLLRHGALIRPWVDQGVALTLPSGISPATLQFLTEQAWENGIDCVRFEQKMNEKTNIEDEKMVIDLDKNEFDI